jgi:hypothetical protein
MPEAAVELMEADMKAKKKDAGQQRKYFFRLTRLNPSAPEWALADGLPVTVQVLGEDDAQARYLVACELWAPSGSGGNLWFRHDLVRVERALLPDPTLPVMHPVGRRGRPRKNMNRELGIRRYR